MADLSKDDVLKLAPARAAASDQEVHEFSGELHSNFALCRAASEC